jgi:NAD(P)H-hydrate repair Nnr-like enzyme with NAD(P)H-hydrate dehydratase domain
MASLSPIVCHWSTLAFATKFLERIKCEPHPVVIAQNPSLVRGVSKFILTRNGEEFIRLQAALDLDLDRTANVAHALGGVTVFAKGRTDVVSDGERVESLADRGAPRRVGGQGDILAGAIGLFVAWGSREFFMAAAAASEIVKAAAVAAYSRNGRGTVTSDILAGLPGVIPES